MTICKNRAYVFGGIGFPTAPQYTYIHTHTHTYIHTHTYTYHSMTICKNRAYVFGGIGFPTATQCLNDLVILNPETWAWTRPDLSGSRPDPRCDYVYGICIVCMYIHMISSPWTLKHGPGRDLIWAARGLILGAMMYIMYEQMFVYVYVCICMYMILCDCVYDVHA
jgi:hypothetical protein